MQNALIITLAALLLGVGCAGPPATTQNPSSPEGAIKTFQQLAGLPDLPIQFMGMAEMPSSPSGNLQVAQYHDSAGRIFSIDTATSQVVELDAAKATPDSSAGSVAMSDAELKSTAESLARSTTPKFDALRASLTYSPGTGDGVYFYSWHTSEQSQYTTPPFIRVGLNVNGELVSYTNTVILPQ